MNSNRYAKSFVALFLIVAAIAVFRWMLLWNVPYTYMDGEFPFWMQQKDYVRSKGEKPEVIFLGDSRMKAGIIPAKLCDNAYNLAVGGGTTVEMYYSLKNYLKFHPKPKMVVMGFGGFHYQWEDCFEGRTLYFHFLPLKNQLETLFVGYRKCGWDFSTFKAKILDTLKYSLLFPQKYSAACINSKFKREEYNRALFENNAAAKGHMYFGRNERADGLNQEANAQTFAVNPRIEQYLHRIIALCKENDIPLVIEQLPMNTPSWNKIITATASEYSPKIKAPIVDIPISVSSLKKSFRIKFPAISCSTPKPQSR